MTNPYMQITKIRFQAVCLFVVSALVLGLFASKVLGQANSQGFNISTTPVVANLETKPGVTTSTKMQVRNNNLNTEHVKLSLLKFTSNNQDGSPQLIDPSANDEFLGWVKFSETKFDAEPNVWKTVDVTISPPATAAFGYYYAIVITRDDATGLPTKVTNLTGAVAIPILLDVNAPGEVRKAEITKFTSDRNVFEFLPATFTVEMENTGNTHVAPRGNIFITKGGKNVGMLEVNEAKGNILPGTKRQYGAGWKDGSPVYKIKMVDGNAVLKDSKPVHSLSWSNFDPSKIRFGKYHAKIVMVYSDGKRDVPTGAELDFWVIPWRIIGALTLLVLLTAGGLWFMVIRPLRKGIKLLPAKRTRKS